MNGTREFAGQLGSSRMAVSTSIVFVVDDDISVRESLEFLIRNEGWQPKTYLLAFDGIIASRGGIPLIDQGVIIGAIGCSGGTDSQDEVVSKAGAAVINQLPTRIK